MRANFLRRTLGQAAQDPVFLARWIRPAINHEQSVRISPWLLMQNFAQVGAKSPALQRP